MFPSRDAVFPQWAASSSNFVPQRLLSQPVNLWHWHLINFPFLFIFWNVDMIEQNKVLTLAWQPLHWQSHITPFSLLCQSVRGCVSGNTPANLGWCDLIINANVLVSEGLKFSSINASEGNHVVLSPLRLHSCKMRHAVTSPAMLASLRHQISYYLISGSPGKRGDT